MKFKSSPLIQLLKQNSGSNLVELLVVMGIFSVVMAGSMSAVSTINKVAVDSVKLHEFQNNHYLNMVKVQNVSTAVKIIKPSQRLLDCFSTRAVGCKIFDKTYSVNPDKLYQCNPSQPNCFFTSNLTYKINCENNFCSSVDFNLDTSDNAPIQSEKRKNKSTLISMPGILFIPKNGVDYSCSAGSLLVSLNYETNVADCSPVKGATQCDSFEPLLSIGSGGCEPLENKACGYGLNTIGLFANQSVCTVPVLPPDCAKDDSCPPSWVAGEWGPCSGTCEKPDGEQNRVVSCLTQNGNPSGACNLATKPVEAQACKADCDEITLYTRLTKGGAKQNCSHDLEGVCGAIDLSHSSDNRDDCEKQLNTKPNIISTEYPGYKIKSQVWLPNVPAGTASPFGCTDPKRETMILKTVLVPK